MSQSWQATTAETQLVGHVAYTCAACSTPILDGQHVFADEDGRIADGQSITRTTRAYHVEHVPPRSED